MLSLTLLILDKSREAYTMVSSASVVATTSPQGLTIVLTKENRINLYSAMDNLLTYAPKPHNRLLFGAQAEQESKSIRKPDCRQLAPAEVIPSGQVQ